MFCLIQLDGLDVEFIISYLLKDLISLTFLHLSHRHQRSTYKQYEISAANAKCTVTHTVPPFKSFLRFIFYKIISLFREEICGQYVKIFWVFFRVIRRARENCGLVNKIKQEQRNIKKICLNCYFDSHFHKTIPATHSNEAQREILALGQITL